MLDRRGDRQLGAAWQPPSDPVEHHAHAMNERGRVPGCAQDFVEAFVLALVDGLLPHECVRLSAQLRVAVHAGARTSSNTISR
jgi:hypothetical protein